MKNLKPKTYPHAPNSSVYDAQAFSIGKSTLVHSPAHYPDSVIVVAKCGVYGTTAGYSLGRHAEWRDSEITCVRCLDA